MDNPRDLHTSPLIKEGYEQEVLKVFDDLASEQSEELSLLEYQLFAGTAQINEPCTPDAIRYLIGKSQEEFAEFSEATNADDKQQEIEEFGDFSWTVAAITENLTPLGPKSDVRPQLAAYVRDALIVNGISEVRNRTLDSGLSLPTIKGLSQADLSRYQPIFYGPFRQAPYLLPETKNAGRYTDDELLNHSEISLQKALQSLTTITRATGVHLPTHVHTFNSIGFSLANSWLLSAALLQSRHGKEAVQDAMFGNIHKLVGRIATQTISKNHR